MDHYQFLSRALHTQGYNGTYFPKPDSPCIYIKGNNGPDGCAIFYRLDAFELVRVETRIVEVWRVQSNQVETQATLFTIPLPLKLLLLPSFSLREDVVNFNNNVFNCFIFLSKQGGDFDDS